MKSAQNNAQLSIRRIGHKYRLIVAIHYDRQILFVLRFLTHAEYDREQWKVDL
jgi:mRNA interferase HigB